jgi:hypothetical protein
MIDGSVYLSSHDFREMAHQHSSSPRPLSRLVDREGMPKTLSSEAVLGVYVRASTETASWM